MYIIAISKQNAFGLSEALAILSEKKSKFLLAYRPENESVTM